MSTRIKLIRKIGLGHTLCVNNRPILETFRIENVRLRGLGRFDGYELGKKYEIIGGTMANMLPNEWYVSWDDYIDPPQRFNTLVECLHYLNDVHVGVSV